MIPTPRLKFYLIIWFLLFAKVTQARVFNFENENLSSFFKGVYSTSAIDQATFLNAGGTNLTYAGRFVYTLSAEFGVSFSMSSINFLLSLEILRPPPIEANTASDAASTDMYNMNNSIIAAGPKLGIQFLFLQMPTSRLFFEIASAYHKVSIKNDYAFTSDGTTAYGVADYTEEGTSFGISAEAHLGYELLVSDNVTMAIDLGYRSLLVGSFTHVRTGTGINGAFTPGAAMKNNDGSDQSVDFTGFTGGISFRFYINLI
jgi:hypothetical protein